MRTIKYACCLIGFLLTVACGQSPTQSEPVEPTVQSAPSPILPTTTASTSTPIRAEPWHGRVFYEIFVRSFYDSDGDGVGDLQGIIEKLDYLNDGDPTTTDDLGVTGLWLMPIMESPSYHGYDVVDYYRVDREYGTKADFQALIAEAHKRDMVVIVDMVLNHTSAQHPWFKQARMSEDSPFREWYVWQDNTPSAPGWHRSDNAYYYGYFWDQMPDLNFRNPAVTESMQAVSRYWLEEMGADGFRLDAVKHLIEDGNIIENTPDTRAWLTAYNSHLDSIDPDTLTVGEVWSPTLTSSKYVLEESLDLVFDFDVAGAILNSARGNRRNVQSAYQLALDTYPNAQFATFITNHDQPRVVSQLFNDPVRAKGAATLLLTSPGVPFVYYGEEIGMTGQKPDELIRTPMQWSADPNGGFTQADQPWEPLNEEWQTRNTAALATNSGSILTHYRTLIQARNRYSALQDGAYIVVESDNRKVYAALRVADDHAVLVVINLGREPTSSYTLWLDKSDLLSDHTMQAIIGDRLPDPLPINANGGFDNYQPFPTLDGLSSHVILLTPAK